ncbi:MAG: extensin [Rhizobiales bacterium]|nr:extensin [Hyphomicrobiales bacterium]
MFQPRANCAAGLVFLYLVSFLQPVYAQPGQVPLPRPRPPQAAVPADPPSKSAADDARETSLPGAPASGQPVPVFDLLAAKACESELTKLRAGFRIAEDITGPGACGVRRPIELSRLSPGIAAVTKPGVDCQVARAMATWAQHVVAPSAKLHLGKTLSGVKVSTTYQCRRRNNAVNGKLSEHAFGNGVDIMGFRFDDGSSLDIALRKGSDKSERAFQAAVRGGACAYFTTVIGPGTNSAHAGHLHLDMVNRRSGYRLCE